MTFFDDLLLDFTEGDGSSSHHHHDDKDEPTITRIIGVVMYVLLLFATAGNYIYKLVKVKKPLSTMAKTFYICFPIFMLLRVVWLIIELVLEHKDDSGLDMFNSVLNRICMCLFLFVFNSLLFYWIDTVHTTVNSAFAKKAFAGSMEFGFVTPLGRILFYVATGAVITLIMALVIARAILKDELDSSDDDYSDKKETVEQLREANNLIISAMFLVFGACFLFYGTKLNCRIGKSGNNKLADLWKTELFSVGLCICFLLRFFFFSFTIFGGHRIDDNVFIVVTYYIPEIIPALLILWSVNTKMFNDSDEPEEDAEEFVDPLLAEEEEDESHL